MEDIVNFLLNQILNNHYRLILDCIWILEHILISNYIPIETNMKMNEDNETVKAMDVLFPLIGEIIGGSQREENLELLKKRIEEMGMDKNELWWYLATRKFGTCVHSGFGLGFERLIMFITGMKNIRDVIPFPRTPQNAEF